MSEISLEDSYDQLAYSDWTDKPQFSKIMILYTISQFESSPWRETKQTSHTK